MTYPATTYAEGVELTITSGNQLHEIMNGDATEEINTESGMVPSVRKALADSMLFKPAIAWSEGSAESDPFQTRLYGEGIYWAPAASNETPIAMGTNPNIDGNWFLAPVTGFDSIASNTNLLSNHNFIIQSPDDITLPSSTPTDYVAGTQIFSGVFAGVDIVGLTYIDGRVSWVSGTLYFSVHNSGALEYVDQTDFVASVADFDGKPRTRGVSYALVGDEYRVTVGVDALEDESANETLLGSVKFEQGSVATGHEAVGNASDQAYAGDKLNIVRFDTVASMIAGYSNIPFEKGMIIETTGRDSISDGGGDKYVIVASSSYPASGENIVWFTVAGGLIAEHLDKSTITTNQAGIFGNETTFSTTVTYEGIQYPVTAYTKNTDYLSELEFISNNFDNPVLSSGATYFSGTFEQTKSNTHWTSEDKFTCLFVFGGWTTSKTLINFDFDNVGFVGEYINVEVPLPIASTPAEVADPTNFIDFNDTNKQLFGFSKAIITGPALDVDYSSHTIGLNNCYVNNRDGTIGRAPNAFSPGKRTKDWFVTNSTLKGIAGQGALLRVCDNGNFTGNIVSEVWAGYVLDSSRGCIGTVMSGNTCKRVSSAFKADGIDDGMGGKDYNYDFNCTGNVFESFEQGKGSSYNFMRLGAFSPIVANNNFRIKRNYLRFFDLQGSVGDASSDNNVVIEGDASSPAMFDVRRSFPQEIDTIVKGFNVRNESTAKTNFILRINELVGSNSNNVTMIGCKVKTTNVNNLGDAVGMVNSDGLIKKLSIKQCDIDCEFISRFLVPLTVDELLIKNNEFRTSANDISLQTVNLTINEKLDISRNDVTVYPGAGVSFRGLLRMPLTTSAANCKVIMKDNDADITDGAVQIYATINSYQASGNTYEASGTRGNSGDMIDIQNVTYMSIQSDSYINKLNLAAQFPITLKIEGDQIVFDNRNALMPLARFSVTRV